MARQALFFAFVFGALSVCGCASTRHVDFESPDADEIIQAINEGSQTHIAKVELADRQRTAAHSLLVAPDTTSWLMGGSITDRFATPTYDVRRVQFNHRGQGAVEGLVLGALVGVAASFGVLLANQEFKDASRGVQMMIPVGSLAGIVFGAIRGNRKTFVFTPQAPPQPIRVPPVVAEEVPPAREPTPRPDPPVVEEAVDETPVVEEEPVVEETPAAEQANEDAPSPVETPVEPEPAAPAPPLVPFDRDVVSWTIVFASYPDQASADAEVARYRTVYSDTGYPIDVIQDGGQYRVIVGQFEKLAEAQTAQQGLADVPLSAWLLYYQPQ